jgi:hypothetical protein
MLLSTGQSKIYEISETDGEKILSIGQLKTSYKQYAKSNFQGNVYCNNDSGLLIKVSKDSIMEWYVKSRRREHIISIKMLDSILVNALFINTEPDIKKRSKIESASHFKYMGKINGELYNVLITTRKAVNDINKLRYYSLTKVQC